MAVSVTMPRLGESVTEGTVTRWLKKEGERVEVDEPLLEVSTDKVDTEIPSPAAGIVTKIVVAEDETVEVGVELAIIGDEGDAAPRRRRRARGRGPGAGAPAERRARAGADPGARARAGAGPAGRCARTGPHPAGPGARGPCPQAPAAAPCTGSGDGGTGGAYVTPLVRKLAAEHDVDLAASAAPASAAASASRTCSTPPRPSPPPRRGRGPARRRAAAARGQAQRGTAVATADQATAAAAATKLRGRTEPLSRLRTVIAKRMVESLQVSAQLTTAVEVDVTRHRAPAHRGQGRLRWPARASSCRSCRSSRWPPIEALKAHPVVNSSIDLEAGTVTYHDSENLGIAVDTERGLLVPVIKNAGDLNLGGMARKIADLAERTRSNKVTPDELGGGTFTLTNTGSRGALWDTPIINQPQVGILGTGAVVKRPAVIDDPELGEVIAVRSQVVLAISYDHRIVDGADAARFLGTIKARLEDGAFEAELGF